MKKGRFLGIDYGTKRIGLAISDENGTLAFPKEILPNNTDTITRLGDIMHKENIGALVIGESVDFSGKLNPLSEKIEIFITELKEKFGLPIYKQKEFLTSVEARKSKNNKHTLTQSQAHSRTKQKRAAPADAGAAALILQRYLDKEAKTNSDKSNNIV